MFGATSAHFEQIDAYRCNGYHSESNERRQEHQEAQLLSYSNPHIGRCSFEQLS